LHLKVVKQINIPEKQKYTKRRGFVRVSAADLLYQSFSSFKEVNKNLLAVELK